MTQILAALKLIFALLPLITQAVHGLQAAFPGLGTAKLDALMVVVQQAAEADDKLREVYTTALPKLAPILSAFVALIKKPAPAATTLAGKLG
jgi:hypothetical protein